MEERNEKKKTGVDVTQKNYKPVLSRVKKKISSRTHRQD